MKKTKTVFYNRSLERALCILCAFSFEIQELALVELSNVLNLSKSTVYRLASTLIKYNFLRYNEESKKYSLGLKLFNLGSIVFSSFSLRQTASSHLTQLHYKLGKTIFLGIFQEDEVIYIDKRENPRDPIKFSSNIGKYRPPYFGMFGQLFLAFLPDSEVERIFDKYPLQPITKKSITKRGEFKKRLIKIREQGFFIEREEAIESVTGISAPIYDYTGKVVASAGAAFISSTVDSEEEIKILSAVCETAKKISNDLGAPSG